jgi:hypothetical protein
MCKKNELEWVLHHSFTGSMEFYITPFAPIPYNSIEILRDVENLGGSGIYTSTSTFYPKLNISAEMYKLITWEREPEIFDVLRKFAERDFGIEAAPKIMEAWRQLGEACKKVPMGHYYLHYLHLNAPNMALYPVEDVKHFIHPPRRTHDPWKMCGFLEHLVSMGTEYLDKITKCFDKCAEGIETGLTTLHQAAQLASLRSQRAMVEEEIIITEAMFCTLRCRANYLKFLKVLIDDAPWKKQQMLELMRSEVKNVKRLKELVEKDCRIGYGWWGRTINPKELGKKIMEMELDIAKLEKRLDYVRQISIYGS